MSLLIARSLSETSSLWTAAGQSAVTIGNFDGVHLGHQALLRATVEAARRRNLKPVALMFDPHPSCVVAPARAPRLLMSPQQRCRRMAEFGIEGVLILPFTLELAALTPQQFAEQYLVKGMNAKIVLVGDNFRFGNKQAGDTRALSDLGRKLGFETEFLPAVKWRGRMVSASEVRRLIQTGDVARAGRMLAQPVSLAGSVVSGRGVGREQTVPTLNLATDAEVLPANGVYVTRTSDPDSQRTWQSITNVGVRPTFDDTAGLTIETYLLELEGNGSELLAGGAPKRIRVEFLHRLRGERRFDTPADLRTQILKDVERCRHFFSLLSRFLSQSGGPGTRC